MTNFSIHSLGMDSKEYLAPASIPVMAAIVSVSSPRLTAFKTASLKLFVVPTHHKQAYSVSTT